MRRRSADLPNLTPGVQADALIFDMDGVLIDSEPLHQRALVSVLSARGHHLGDEEYDALVGISQEKTWAWLSSRFGLRGDLSGYRAAYEAAVLQLLHGRLKPEPGAVELVGGLLRVGWRLALASSSPARWVEATLAGLGLEKAFEVVVSGDRIARGKPDPEIFLTAARLLGVSPARALVIEDSLPGLEAASRAGMAVIAVRTRYTRGRPLPADYVVDSLAQLLPTLRGGEGGDGGEGGNEQG